MEESVGCFSFSRFVTRVCPLSRNVQRFSVKYHAQPVVCIHVTTKGLFRHSALCRCRATILSLHLCNYLPITALFSWVWHRPKRSKQWKFLDCATAQKKTFDRISQFVCCVNAQRMVKSAFYFCTIIAPPRNNGVSPSCHQYVVGRLWLVVRGGARRHIRSLRFKS
jgi:hypothetical protein